MQTKEQFNKELDELGVKINLLTKDVKDQYKEQVEDLKNRWDVLKEKWNVMTELGGETWENVKEGFKGGMAEIQDSYDDLKRKL